MTLFHPSILVSFSWIVQVRHHPRITAPRDSQPYVRVASVRGTQDQLGCKAPSLRQDSFQKIHICWVTLHLDQASIQSRSPDI